MTTLGQDAVDVKRYKRINHAALYASALVTCHAQAAWHKWAR